MQRKYTKESPEILPDHPQVQNQTEEHCISVSFPALPDEYRKADGYVVPESFIIVISGGEKREKDYFRLITANKNKFSRIKIEFIAEPDKLTPDGLLEIAESKLQHYKSSETEETPDDYYLLSDVDHFINDLKRIKPRCQALKLNLIISNPCFEVWLYYSKKYDKFLNFEIPDDYLKISSALKTYLGQAVKGGCNPVKAIFDIQVNIDNAKANYDEDADGIPILYATQMYILAEKILPFILKELEYLKGRTSIPH